MQQNKFSYEMNKKVKKVSGTIAICRFKDSKPIVLTSFYPIQNKMKTSQ